MNLSPFSSPRSSFDDTERKDIAKAVVIAGLSALVARVVDVVGEEAKAWLAARRTKSGGTR